jgi:hypothetical protein
LKELERRHPKRQRDNFVNRPKPPAAGELALTFWEDLAMVPPWIGTTPELTEDKPMTRTDVWKILPSLALVLGMGVVWGQECPVGGGKNTAAGEQNDKERQSVQRLAKPISLDFKDQPLKKVLDDLRSVNATWPFIDYCTPLQMIAPCVATEAVMVSQSSWMCRVAPESGWVIVTSPPGADTSFAFESMTLSIAGGGQVKLCVPGRQIQIRSAYFEASADFMTRVGVEERILLEGHVRVKYHNGANAEVYADRVNVGLADGRLEINPQTTTGSASLPQEKNDEDFPWYEGLWAFFP